MFPDALSQGTPSWLWYSGFIPVLILSSLHHSGSQSPHNAVLMGRWTVKTKVTLYGITNVPSSCSESALRHMGKLDTENARLPSPSSLELLPTSSSTSQENTNVLPTWIVTIRYTPGSQKLLLVLCNLILNLISILSFFGTRFLNLLYCHFGSVGGYPKYCRIFSIITVLHSLDASTSNHTLPH